MFGENVANDRPGPAFWTYTIGCDYLAKTFYKPAVPGKVLSPTPCVEFEKEPSHGDPQTEKIRFFCSGFLFIR